MITGSATKGRTLGRSSEETAEHGGTSMAQHRTMSVGAAPPLTLDETFEALLVDWEAVALGGGDHRQLAARLEALCAAGCHVFLISADNLEALDGQLGARPSGQGRLHLCCEHGSSVFMVTERGPSLVARRSVEGKADAARFAAQWLAERGITGRLILVVGEEPMAIEAQRHHDLDPARSLMIEALARAAPFSLGPRAPGSEEGDASVGARLDALLALLDNQLARRANRRVPQIDPDPEWVLPLPTTQTTERVVETLGTLANGWAGTRGSREENGHAAFPLFAVSGAYDDRNHLLEGPLWTELDFTPNRRHHDRRVLDLRTATLARFPATDSGLRSLRFVSAASPHVMGLRAEASVAQLEPGEPLRAPAHGARFDRRVEAGDWLAQTSDGDEQIAVAAGDRLTRLRELAVVERLATWSRGRRGEPNGAVAQRRLLDARTAGFDALLAAHRATWASWWRDAEVSIEGGDDARADQLAARFCIFHLLSAAAEEGEAAVGARGLTGDAYAGHVFWDADVFVLPALAAIRPRAARAMLEYRVRRLPAARAIARARGLSGARFPWESARDGTDVTPRVVRGPHGEQIAIATGGHEEHIVADVAWAAHCYATWSGDDAFLLEGGGRDLVVETARYWASRIRLDRAGSGHLYGVMGPDEYHEVVDDNAYTNVMARWNLRQGAALLTGSTDADEVAEAERWRELSERLVDGWHPDRQLYEQFSGYFDLEPLIVSQIARPPVAIDVLLGHRRVAASQLIKQADVLMLHHLVPQEVVEGSLQPCLAFYEPRTAHGSSLSPAISASLQARAGDTEAALELFRVASRLDLDDVTGTTAGGIHLAAMGGVWQALAYGFLGLAAQPDALAVDPHLPQAWSAVTLRFRFRGRRIGIRATHHEVTVCCDAPLTVALGGRAPQRCVPPSTTLPLGLDAATRARKEAGHERRAGSR